MGYDQITQDVKTVNQFLISLENFRHLTKFYCCRLRGTCPVSFISMILIAVIEESIILLYVTKVKANLS